jgi:hypothetical protein
MSNMQTNEAMKVGATVCPISMELAGDSRRGMHKSDKRIAKSAQRICAVVV